MGLLLNIYSYNFVNKWNFKNYGYFGFEYLIGMGFKYRDWYECDVLYVIFIWILLNYNILNYWMYWLVKLIDLKLLVLEMDFNFL